MWRAPTGEPSGDPRLGLEGSSAEGLIVALAFPALSSTEELDPAANFANFAPSNDVGARRKVVSRRRVMIFNWLSAFSISLWTYSWKALSVASSAVMSSVESAMTSQ